MTAVVLHSTLPPAHLRHQLLYSCAQLLFRRDGGLQLPCAAAAGAALGGRCLQRFGATLWCLAVLSNSYCHDAVQVDWDKGRALLHLLEVLGLHKQVDVLPIYIGDDKTDEDAFKALQVGPWLTEQHWVVCSWRYWRDI